MIDRHDFTENQRDLLNTAVSCGLVDAVELACMVKSYSDDSLIMGISFHEAIDVMIDGLEAGAYWARLSDDESKQEAWSRWVSFRARGTTPDPGITTKGAS